MQKSVVKTEKFTYLPGKVVNDDDCQIIESYTSGDEDENAKATEDENILQKEPLRKRHGYKYILIDAEIPNTNVPYIIKDDDDIKWISVRIIDKIIIGPNYDPNYPPEVLSYGKLHVFRMTEEDANLLNDININYTTPSYLYGAEPFRVGDNIVDYEDFIKFYQILKKHGKLLPGSKRRIEQNKQLQLQKQLQQKTEMPVMKQQVQPPLKSIQPNPPQQHQQHQKIISTHQPQVTRDNQACASPVQNSQHLVPQNSNEPSHLQQLQQFSQNHGIPMQPQSIHYQTMPPTQVIVNNYTHTQPPQSLMTQHLQYHPQNSHFYGNYHQMQPTQAHFHDSYHDYRPQQNPSIYVQNFRQSPLMMHPLVSHHPQHQQSPNIQVIMNQTQIQPQNMRSTQQQRPIRPFMQSNAVAPVALLSSTQPPKPSSDRHLKELLNERVNSAATLMLNMDIASKDKIITPPPLPNLSRIRAVANIQPQPSVSLVETSSIMTPAIDTLPRPSIDVSQPVREEVLETREITRESSSKHDLRLTKEISSEQTPRNEEPFTSEVLDEPLVAQEQQPSNKEEIDNDLCIIEKVAKPKVQGRWVQMNDIIVPFIEYDEKEYEYSFTSHFGKCKKYIPLTILAETNLDVDLAAIKSTRDATKTEIDTFNEIIVKCKLNSSLDEPSKLVNLTEFYFNSKKPIFIKNIGIVNNLENMKTFKNFSDVLSYKGGLAMLKETTSQKFPIPFIRHNQKILVPTSCLYSNEKYQKLPREILNQHERICYTEFLTLMLTFVAIEDYQIRFGFGFLDVAYLFQIDFKLIAEYTPDFPRDWKKYLKEFCGEMVNETQEVASSFCKIATACSIHNEELNETPTTSVNKQPPKLVEEARSIDDKPFEEDLDLINKKKVKKRCKKLSESSVEQLTSLKRATSCSNENDLDTRSKSLSRKKRKFNEQEFIPLGTYRTLSIEKTRPKPKELDPVSKSIKRNPDLFTCDESDFNEDIIQVGLKKKQTFFNTQAYLKKHNIKPCIVKMGDKLDHNKRKIKLSDLPSPSFLSSVTITTTTTTSKSTLSNIENKASVKKRVATNKKTNTRLSNNSSRQIKNVNQNASK